MKMLYLVGGEGYRWMTPRRRRIMVRRHVPQPQVPEPRDFEDFEPPADPCTDCDHRICEQCDVAVSALD